MWAAGGWGPRLEGPPCDVGFTEAISQRMQVPLRLRVLGAGEPEGGTRVEREVPPPSFQMHVPERLCLAEMTDSRPFFGTQLQRHPCLVRVDDPPLDLAIQAMVYGEHPFLSFVSPPHGSQKRKRPGHHHSRARKERGGPLVEVPQLAIEGTARQRQERLEPSAPSSCWSQRRAPLSPPPQFPPFPREGRIYSLQNILQALRFLGQQLVQLFQRHRPATPSSREMSLVLEGSLEEFGPTDILAMRKQLMKISGRLRALEGQSVGWRQKELLFCSLLVSACLLNAWLWLRR